MTSKKIIEVDKLTAGFGRRKVLHDVHFEVYEKEITVILGSSGAGKSVLFKHMLGLIEIVNGSVMIHDHEIAGIDEEELNNLYMKIGVLFQNGGLLNSLTIGENLALPLEQHTRLNRDIINQLVSAKLHLVNLPDVIDLYPSQLSGGMLKRAALARAIIMDPEILFCDEPGAGLDPVTLYSLDKLIVNLRDQLGMSVIIVTHELSSIFRIADRIIFLKNGEMIFQGDLQDALKTDQKDLIAFFEKGKFKTE